MKIDDLYIKQAEKELKDYLNLLKKWQKAVNLVSKTTLEDAWMRHIIDSAQLYPLIPSKATSLLDMGSGAGFPGLVLAILNQKNKGNLKNIFLVESDMKKCLFLKEVSRQLSIPVTVLNNRLETIDNLSIDVVTSRALAPFSTLLKLGKGFISPETTCLFLKGEKEEHELKQCPINCCVEKIQSTTHHHSFILKVKGVQYD